MSYARGGGGHGGGGHGGGGHAGGHGGGFHGGGRGGGAFHGGGRGGFREAGRGGLRGGYARGYGGYGRGYGGYGRGYGYGGYGGYGGWGWGGLGGWGWGWPYYGGYGGYGGDYIYSPNYYETYTYPDYAQSPYYFGGYNTPPSTTALSGYYPPPAASNTEASLSVHVPANAQVWVDGNLMTQTGDWRSFVTPPLEPGVDYHYNVRARWTDPNGQVVDQTRQVDVRAGQLSTVDFLRP